MMKLKDNAVRLSAILLSALLIALLLMAFPIKDRMAQKPNFASLVPTTQVIRSQQSQLGEDDLSPVEQMERQDSLFLAATKDIVTPQEVKKISKGKKTRTTAKIRLQKLLKSEKPQELQEPQKLQQTDKELQQKDKELQQKAQELQLAINNPQDSLLHEKLQNEKLQNDSLINSTQATNLLTKLQTDNVSEHKDLSH